jgi:hypothetical protein
LASRTAKIRARNNFWRQILAWDRSISVAMLSLFIVAMESQPSKMKYLIVGKVPKYNRKIVETQKQKSMLATHIDDNDRIQWV